MTNHVWRILPPNHASLGQRGARLTCQTCAGSPSRPGEPDQCAVIGPEAERGAMVPSSRATISQSGRRPMPGSIPSEGSTCRVHPARDQAHAAKPGGPDRHSDHATCRGVRRRSLAGSRMAASSARFVSSLTIVRRPINVPPLRSYACRVRQPSNNPGSAAAAAIRHLGRSARIRTLRAGRQRASVARLRASSSLSGSLARTGRVNRHQGASATTRRHLDWVPSRCPPSDTSHVRSSPAATRHVNIRWFPDAR